MLGQRPLLFLALIFLLACWRVNTAQLTNVGRVQTPAPSNVTLYAWSSWGSWSACSRSCGGGVSVQERQCLPRDPVRWRRRKRRKLSSAERVNRTPREIRDSSPAQQCPGLDKRYHECNTNPCQGPLREPRAEQCASYDRRPFRGHFYTWVPYVDGNAPCILNCRPRGQQFYASLGLVSDGTPCTKPGYRAICVDGECKVVGRETVLAAGGAGEGLSARCGRRLVSGLFTRPRLPLGYSYVATVPRGACRLNVSEIVPSENYIALKVMNGSYIMNGDFAVSAPGAYEAIGARFQYSRVGSIDNVFAHGPLQHPIDIMILYTQANPSIKYEYLTDNQDETSNDIPNVGQPHNQPAQRHHRHHVAEPRTRALEHKPSPKPSNGLESQSLETNVISNRRFIWKIIAYTQCSRSCGGGLQIGKFKCVEVDGKEDREVSPAHCSGTPPPSRRRRCGGTPCPARWRAAPWGPCPVCGPAHRTRIVGCVQDHAKGITKISDQECQLPMPVTTEPCEIPNCEDATSTSSEPTRPDARRQVRPNDRIDHFRDGPVVSLASTFNVTEKNSNPNFSHSAVGGWLYTEWSECVGWCVGGGVQSRGVRCADPAGCAPRHAPQPSQTCSLRTQCDPHEGQWFTGEWSKCSAACGGRQVRGVLCIGGTGRRLRDAACRAQRPEQDRACGGSCAPSWYLSDWGECQGPCEAAIQTRTVWCTKGGVEGGSGATRDSDCPGTRPLARRNCVPPRCSTRPSARTTVLNPVQAVSDTQQRVTRHQSRNPQNVDIKERSFTDARKICEDKLTNCVLAVQARLCHYHYYAEYCCRSCRGV